MFPIRVKTVQESDLRMLGSLARNIQRVLPVTQADIDAAAALGKGWVVWKVFEVSDPLDNMRGGTQLIIRQNSIQPGQNVRRVIFVSGPGGQTVVIRGGDYIVLPDAIANSLSYVKAFGGTEQGIPDGYTLVDFIMSDANSYIETDISVNDSDEVDFYWHTDRTGSVFAFSQGVSTDNAAFQLANATSATPPGVVFDIENYTPYRISTGVNANTNTMLHIQIINKEIFIGGVSYGTSGGTLTAPTEKLRLFCSSAGVSSVSYMGRFTVKGKIDLFPCTRDSDGAVGFYDAISGTFLTNAGTGTLTAGLPAAAIKATPDNPVQIISNNGVLKFSLNEFDPNAVELGYYRNASTGAKAESPYNFLTAMMPVKPNTSYVMFGRKKLDNSISAYNRIYWFDSNQDFISTSSYSVRTVTIATSPANAAYAQGGINESGGTSIPTTQEIVDDYNWVFQQGTAEVSYTPYSPTGFYTDGTVETIQTRLSGITPEDFVAANATITKKIGLYSYDFSYSPTSASTWNGIVKGGINTIEGHKYYYCAEMSASAQSILSISFGGGLTGVSKNKTAVEPNTVYLLHNVAEATASDSSNTMYVRCGYTGTGDYTGTAHNIGLFDLTEMFGAGNEPATADAARAALGFQTATAEMLLKLLNKSGAAIYTQDVQNVTTGEITRNVGVKVFVGTETWTMGINQDASNNRVFYTNIEDRKIQDTNMGLLCSHFNFKGTVGYSTLTTGEFCINQSIKSVYFDGNGITTVSDWKQWLADQYAAGTPVIVLYPLETPTTESVAGQALQVTDGDNIVEITQASLSELELEAEYTKVA